ncbi:hypothetical protein [Desulfocurvus sp.]|uniref:hypothetical protein n=1 Tax=Desulfocurvus sp. TaxID=2871698 RepID=UPI0025BA6178|nr:hypothetical protein [Desulfocurvus sp.]MCK9238956.1 hypothetical protein [Desulfocurvus sp.]
MKDERGLYYYPSMQTRDVRMYVRQSEEGGIEFRMWNKDLPEVWERHEWIPLDVVRTAARMYALRNKDRNPAGLYDEAVARRLLDEDR